MRKILRWEHLQSDHHWKGLPGNTYSDGPFLNLSANDEDVYDNEDEDEDEDN